MPVPTGTASLLDIQNEFGGSNPISLSEYYGAASGVPTSGTISINDFRGLSNNAPITRVFTGKALYNAGLKGGPGFYNTGFNPIFTGQQQVGYVNDIFMYEGGDPAVDKAVWQFTWGEFGFDIVIANQPPDGTLPDRGYRMPGDGTTSFVFSPKFISLTVSIDGYTWTITPTSNNYNGTIDAFGNLAFSPLLQQITPKQYPNPVSFSNLNYTVTLVTQQ